MSWAVILTFWWVCAGMCVCSEVCRPQCWMHFSSIYAACSNPLWTPPSLSGVFYPENVDFFSTLIWKHDTIFASNMETSSHWNSQWRYSYCDHGFKDRNKKMIPMHFVHTCFKYPGWLCAETAGRTQQKEMIKHQETAVNWKQQNTERWRESFFLKLLSELCRESVSVEGLRCFSEVWTDSSYLSQCKTSKGFILQLVWNQLKLIEGSPKIWNMIFRINS